jgi:hypothetical protein
VGLPDIFGGDETKLQSVLNEVVDRLTGELKDLVLVAEDKLASISTLTIGQLEELVSKQDGWEVEITVPPIVVGPINIKLSKPK